MVQKLNFRIFIFIFYLTFFHILEAAPFSHSLPSLIPENSEAYTDLVEKIENLSHTAPLNPTRRALINKSLLKYFLFLGADTTTQEGKTAFNTAFNRFRLASNQFLICEDIEDWKCLEKNPELDPKVDWRKSSGEFGKAIWAGETLNIEWFFNQHWNNFDNSNSNQEPTVAKTLASKIITQGKKSIWFALYGMEDLKGSLKEVYDALLEAKANDVLIKGVVDVDIDRDRMPKLTEDLGRETLVTVAEVPEIFDFNPIKANANHRKPWLFDEKYQSHLFMYDETPQLFRDFNNEATVSSEAPLQVEWPDRGIMHNKFFVFENNRNRFSIWTGTANTTESCMGSEKNTNLSLFIQNNIIAKKAFIPEILEMHSGKFHSDKRANTYRYFTFDDDTEFRIHFSPTDDGEHRTIIPMLLSARKEDHIRVAMFGSGGLEFVRAFQYALAKGADVTIIIDAFSGGGSDWFKADGYASLQQDNPYEIAGRSVGKLKWYFSSWQGLNHYKIATLTRKKTNRMIAETIIVGSQNWSTSGNDDNDENMITIRNPRGVPLATAFNKEFDEKLLPAARDHHN